MACRYHALFVGQLYLLEGSLPNQRIPYWPSENIDGLIRRGAMKSKKGQVAKIAITVELNCFCES